MHRGFPRNRFALILDSKLLGIPITGANHSGSNTLTTRPDLQIALHSKSTLHFEMEEIFAYSSDLPLISGLDIAHTLGKASHGIPLLAISLTVLKDFPGDGRVDCLVALELCWQSELAPL